MKFTVTIKDPDVFEEAIRDAVVDDVNQLSLSEDEKEALVDIRVAKTEELIRKWVEYGEYIRVEFDTEAKTATVVERGR